MPEEYTVNEIYRIIDGKHPDAGQMVELDEIDETGEGGKVNYTRPDGSRIVNHPVTWAQLGDTTDPVDYSEVEGGDEEMSESETETPEEETPEEETPEEETPAEGADKADEAEADKAPE